MGGRKPTSPSVIPGTPPRGMTDNTGDFDSLLRPLPVPPRGRRVGRRTGRRPGGGIGPRRDPRRDPRRPVGRRVGRRTPRDPRRPVGIFGLVGNAIRDMEGFGGPRGDRPVTGRRTGQRRTGPRDPRGSRPPVGRRVGRRTPRDP